MNSLTPPSITAGHLADNSIAGRLTLVAALLFRLDASPARRARRPVRTASTSRRTRGLAIHHLLHSRPPRRRPAPSQRQP